MPFNLSLKNVLTSVIAQYTSILLKVFFFFWQDIGIKTVKGQF